MHLRRNVAVLTTAIAIIAVSSNGSIAATKKTTKKVAATTTKATAAPSTAAPSTAAPSTAAPTTAAPDKAKVGDTLTIGMAAAPATLDPGKASIQPQQTFQISMAYEPLLRANADLTYSPGLAESWSFDGLNENLTIKLRKGLKFADGTPLDAAAAAASMNYHRKTSPAIAQFPTVKDVKATDATTIVVSQTTSNPEITRFYSTYYLGGSIISPAGLADPSKMNTASFGAGPYVLDAGATVAGSTYTYVPNKNYYDLSKQNWKKVVFRVIPDTAARVQAVQTGQVDTTQVDGTVVDAAKAAGLVVSVGAPIATFGLLVGDRAGVVNPALADQNVRTAMGYAIDRAAVCKASLGAAGGAARAGFPGVSYDTALDKKWAFNLEKAKQLMADSGYPNGFKLVLEATAIPPFSVLGLAVAGQLKKIGIDVEITSNPSVPASQTAQRAQKYGVYLYGFGNGLPLATSTTFLNNGATTFNPFGTRDTQISDWLTQAPALPAKDAAKLFDKAYSRALDLGWVVNVCGFNGVSIGNKKVTGWENPEQGSFAFPNEYVPN